MIFPLDGEFLVNFFLVLVRIASIFMISPILSSKYIPAKFKIGLSLLLSIMVFPMVPRLAAPHSRIAGVPACAPFPPGDIFSLIYLIGEQMILGFLIGTLVSFVFISIQTAGELIDLQMGFATSSILDPQTNTPVSLVGNLYNFLALIAFVGLDGHHWLLLGIINSFKACPPGRLKLSNNFFEFFIRSFSDILIVGFKVAIPIVAALLMIDIISGFISRMIPQINILIIGLPFKIAFGYILLILGLPAFFYLLKDYFLEVQYMLLRVFLL